MILNMWIIWWFSFNVTTISLLVVLQIQNKYNLIKKHIFVIGSNKVDKFILIFSKAAFGNVDVKFIQFKSKQYDDFVYNFILTLNYFESKPG